MEQRRSNQVETVAETAAAEPRELRRQQLIDATITSISKYGLSNTTLVKVTQIAGLSPGIVNFYFNSKDALLVTSLKFLTEEFEAAWKDAIAGAGDDAADQLLALSDVNFARPTCEPERIAVWLAFWGETQARQDYLTLCGDRDTAFIEQIQILCERIIAEGGYSNLDADAIAQGLNGIIDSKWQTLLVSATSDDLAEAKRTCRAYLASVFPGRFEMPGRTRAGNGATAGEPARDTGQVAGVEANGIPLTLPAWTYQNAELFELEREHIFLPNWQLVCHVNDVVKAGDYMTFNLLGERAVVIRGEDGELRAFHNVCRHRAHAVVQGHSGTCRKTMRCPYHGWTYGLDGRLKAVAAHKSFPDIDKANFGLIPIELEVFMGFIYIRFQGDGPSVAERMAPYAEELALYRFEEMQPFDHIWVEKSGVDWKNVWDNYLEGYHFVTGHPGLYDLMGAGYDIEARPEGTARLSQRIREKPAKTWSARHYQKLLPEVAHLPDDLRRAWSYICLFPGVSFDIYPDKMDFFQVLPTGPGQSTLRGRTYALPDSSREMRASRYLNLRLNIQVQNEDNELIRSVQQGLGSSSYTVGLLSEKEAVVKGLHDWVRAQLPVAQLARPPAPGTIAERNRAMGH